MTAYVALVRAWISALRLRIREDAGSPTLETVIIAGALALAAVGATAYIVSKINEHAHQIK
jgi:hypothetical protein